MKQRLALAALILAASTPALAADIWKAGMTIQGIQILMDGGFIMYGPPSSGPTCPEGDIFYVRPNLNGQTAATVKNTLAMVLTAQTMGKTVSFSYENVGCNVNTLILNP